jgi:cyanophycin synthetase
VLGLPFLNRRRTVYVSDRTAEYRSYWSAAAASLDAEFIELTDRIWEVRQGALRTRIANDLLELDDPVTLAVAGDKALCYRLASALGVPVPGHRLFERTDLSGIWRSIRRDGHPFVIKPRRNTSSGVGVTVGVLHRTDVLGAVLRAGIRDRAVIVERMAAGETCRLLFLGGELVHAVRRRGVRLIPDGQTNIRTLLSAAGKEHLLSDRATALTLAAQNLTFDSVPDRDVPLVVRVLPEGEFGTSELRTVYDEDITELVGRDLVREVKQVVDAVGSEWAGVDIITVDPSRTLREAGGFLLEVNTTPGLHHHCALATVKPCDLAVRVLRYALSPERRQG